MSTPIMARTNGRPAPQHGEMGDRPHKPRIPGYTATIVRADVKDELRLFRQRHGYLNSEHIERCLTSAALAMVLRDPSLTKRLLENLDEAVLEDTRLLRRSAEADR